MKVKIKRILGHYHYLQEGRQVWRVEINPANNCIFVVHQPTFKVWHLSASEFIYNSAMFNKEVEKFPNYIHYNAWKLVDYVRRVNNSN